MSITSELTALADAIRIKSGISGKLTIPGMADAVDGIETGGGGMDFFECVFVDDGGTIKAYNNIQITGVAFPVAANDNYALLQPTAAGTARIWQAGGFSCGFDSAKKRWIIADGKPEFSNALFYSPSGILTMEDGSKANPKLWKTIADPDNSTQTVQFHTGEAVSGPADNYRTYIYVKLLAGVEYTIGMTNPSGQDNKIYLYDAAGTPVAEDDDGGITIDGVSCNDAINYTPTADGVFIIGAGAYSSATGYTKVVCYPAPQDIETLPSAPWNVEEWTAASGSGTPVVTPLAVPERPATGVKAWSGYRAVQNEETAVWSISTEVVTDLPVRGSTPKIGEIYSTDTTIRVKKLYNDANYIIPADGLVFFAPLATDYANLVNEEQAVIQGGQFTTYNGLRCVYLDGSAYIKWADDSNLPTGAESCSLFILVSPQAQSEWRTYISMGQEKRDHVNISLGNGVFLEWGGTPLRVDGKWHSLCLVRNNQGEASAYIDGTFNASGIRDGILPTPSCMCVGANMESIYIQKVKSYVANVAAYDRELSASEIVEIHNTLMQGVVQ